MAFCLDYDLIMMCFIKALGSMNGKYPMCPKQRPAKEKTFQEGEEVNIRVYYVQVHTLFTHIYEVYILTKLFGLYCNIDCIYYT